VDYGHDLRFGTFVTPAIGDPARTVAAAVATERAGLDLVTFQDHPYQARFLDTWTLISYAAARTERISLAPNVANLPLRPPAVLARSAASLDALTGGRVELGLGAGAFWDAIDAMGGRRLPPPQAVDALAEGISVIRAIWGQGPSTRFDGDHYFLHGAKAAAPAHAIGIWLGAYKPRMLALTGSVADGWLPSLGQMQAQGMPTVADANARIDGAAIAAGREPAEIRRLLNVDGIDDHPPREWADILTGLVLEHGFSTFVFPGDDPDRYAVVGSEIAPAVREAVAAERGD